MLGKNATDSWLRVLPVRETRELKSPPARGPQCEAYFSSSLWVKLHLSIDRWIYVYPTESLEILASFSLICKGVLSVLVQLCY